MEYTKGEWIFYKHGITYKIECDRLGKLPYQICGSIYNKANARLLAIAPRMYETIKSAIVEIEDGSANHAHLILSQVLSELED